MINGNFLFKDIFPILMDIFESQKFNGMIKKLRNLFSLATVMISTTVLAQNPDASVEDIIMDDVYAAGTQQTVNIKFKNSGTASFSGVTLNWSADGGQTVNSYALPGFPFSAGASFTLAHNVKVVFSNPGTYTDMKVWTSNPGGTTDVNPSNDTLVKAIFVNNGLTVTKRVMIEEFTTVPCGFCPDGAYTLENVLVSNPNAIGLGVHAGFGTDAMTIPEHSIIANAFTTGAPAAVFDRFRFNPSGNVATSARGDWNSRTNLRSQELAPVDLIINGTFDNVTRQAIVTVNANFVDYPLPGDLRLGLMVVEDSVIGSGSGYNQVNYYNNQSGHPYFQAGNPILNYPHRHVVRDVFPANNPWGEAGIIPNNPAPGSSYNQTYTFQINSAWDEEKISLVAFVAYYNTPTDERPIINAGEVKLNDIVTSLVEVERGIEKAKVYPNPASDLAFVEFKLAQNARVQVDVVDITGKTVRLEQASQYAAGNQLIKIPVSDLEAGIYFVRIQAGSKLITKKLSIVH